MRFESVFKLGTLRLCRGRHVVREYPSGALDKAKVTIVWWLLADTNKVSRTSNLNLTRVISS